MFLQRAFKINVVVTAGVLSLLVLPVSGVCQSESVQAEEPPETIEEVIVRGIKPLRRLKHEMYKAEDALYDLFKERHKLTLAGLPPQRQPLKQRLL